MATLSEQASLPWLDEFGRPLGPLLALLRSLDAMSLEWVVTVAAKMQLSHSVGQRTDVSRNVFLR
jgi:hypothetical protein